jgi:hypothetical protein
MTNNFDIGKFNSFIQAASQQISCGSECQKEKKAKELKDKYLNAEANLSLAEPQYQISKKEYYSYVNGQDSYNQMLEEEESSRADKITEKINDKITTTINNINSLLQTYDGLLINFRNVLDLFRQYKKENRFLEQKLKDESNDVLINNRKTYYEDQNISSLNSIYYYILLIIYIIVVICFIIFSLIYPSTISLKIKLLLLVVFIALPFISTFILGKIIEFIYWIFNLLPKNVYL